jgi:uncharacterized protein (DUF433 family)
VNSGTFIVKTPGVQGGRACIRTTRIPVYQILIMALQCLNQEEVLRALPDLTTDDLDGVVEYSCMDDETAAELFRDIEECDPESAEVLRAMYGPAWGPQLLTSFGARQTTQDNDDTH